MRLEAGFELRRLEAGFALRRLEAGYGLMRLEADALTGWICVYGLEVGFTQVLQRMWNKRSTVLQSYSLTRRNWKTK